jgi:hypothetical protein
MFILVCLELVNIVDMSFFWGMTIIMFLLQGRILDAFVGKFSTFKRTIPQVICDCCVIFHVKFDKYLDILLCISVDLSG